MLRSLLSPIAILGYILVGFLGFLAFRYVLAYSCFETPLAGPCTRVLFVGNSHTFTNDLPQMFAGLARAGGHRVETGMAAEGGWTLADHAGSAQTAEQIGAGPWQYVVLQEQSQIPAVQRLRDKWMNPPARQLDRLIRAAGATPVFFVTWARREGWPEQGLTSYQRMQAQVTRGYQGIAEELGAPLAPAGEAWRLAMREDPGLTLWQPDGNHPNELGTYLAACVFYATIFGESPEGLSYTAGLPSETAQALQRVAARVVLNSPREWNLPAGREP